MYISAVAEQLRDTVTCCTTTAIWQPLYRTTCVSQHPIEELEDFAGAKLLPTCPCWWQLAHSDYGEDTRVLHSDVTCSISI